MAPPVVYVAVAVIGVVAVGLAFHDFVYEPHIAPKLEAWSEARRQRRRQRQAVPVLAVNRDRPDDDTRSHGSTDDEEREDEMNGIELEHLAARERRELAASANSSGLRRRNTAVILEEESDAFIPHPVMTPTHVIIDASAPSSPGGLSIRTSTLPSVNNSPAHPPLTFQPTTVVNSPPVPPPRAMSPRLLTPVSNSPTSSRAQTPSTLLSERPLLFPTLSSQDLGTSQVIVSSYNTPLSGSAISDNDHAHDDVLSSPDSRIQSPFSDIHVVDPLNSPQHAASTSGDVSPQGVQSPSIASDFTLDSDEDFDVLSPRSGICSPPGHVGPIDDGPFEDVSWANIGHYFSSGHT